MWDQLNPWLAGLAIAATLAAGFAPVYRKKGREAQDKAAEALAQTQAHRIATLEGERDDLRAALDRERAARRAAEQKAKDRLEIILEKAKRNDRD